MTGTSYADGQVVLHAGDCLDVLRTLSDASVDSVVTDPPYGLSFMGKEWDRPTPRVLSACVNCGNDDPTEGYTVCSDCLEAFGHEGDQYAVKQEQHGGRGMLGHVSKNWHEKGTHSRGYADNDNAAFQRWCHQWATECLRVLRPGGHLLAFGGTRTWHRLACAIEDAGFEVRDSIAWMYGSGFPKSLNLPGGLGTALKPAHEPIVVARRPLTGTVASNVLQHGTGALNIDRCRVGRDEGDRTEYGRGRHLPHANTAESLGRFAEVTPYEPHTAGRWPANVVLDESSAARLDQQSGDVGGGFGVRGGGGGGDWNPTDRDESVGQSIRGDGRTVGFGDSGGASRFFYVAKADASERVRVNGTAHPTVKPLALMRWLVRLVTPPGGTVLEPFAGSGTTVEACLLEGFACVAIEREPDYLPLIVQRINRRRDPIAAARAVGDDLGLFGEDTA